LLAKGTYFPDVLAALKKVLAFKRAKKSLGIRSLHAGFGARSQWLWELPQEKELAAKAEPQAAPAHRIPSDWVEGVACLDPDRPPPDVPRHRWRQFTFRDRSGRMTGTAERMRD
jgi:hypothetical protein